jgi:O-antigen ligase
MIAIRKWSMRLAFALLWLFVFSMPSEKSITISDFGTISRLLGAVAMGAGVIAIVLQGRLRMPSPFHLMVSLFILWAAISYRWSLDPDATLIRTQTNIQLIAVLWLIWEICPGEARVENLMEAYVLGTLVPAVNTVQRYLLGKMTYYQRYATEGFDPNDLALTLALSLPLSYALSLRRTGVRPWIYRLQMVTSMMTIFLSASRGGTMAMILALSLVVWTLGELPRRRRVALLVLGGVALGVAISLTPSTTWTRLATTASEIQEGTLNDRTMLWKAGLTAYVNDPYFGVGAGAYPETVAAWIGRPWIFVPVAHNSFLSILVETGLVGLALFGGALLLLIRAARRLPSLPRKMWLTEMAVWTLGVSSLTWEYRKVTWLVFGLLAGHAAALLRPRAGTAAVAQPAGGQSTYTTVRVAEVTA